MWFGPSEFSDCNGHMIVSVIYLMLNNEYLALSWETYIVLFLGSFFEFPNFDLIIWIILKQFKWNLNGFQDLKVFFFFYGMVQLFAPIILCYKDELLACLDHFVCVGSNINTSALVKDLKKFGFQTHWSSIIKTSSGSTSWKRVQLLLIRVPRFFWSIPNSSELSIIPSTCQKRHIGLVIDAHSHWFNFKLLVLFLMFILIIMD